MTATFVDNRPGAVAERNLADAVSNSPMVSAHRARQLGVIQRYSQGQGGMRYSDGHQIMLLNSTSLWAKDGPIATSNTILDRKLSFVKLVKTGLKIESAFGGTLHEIKPAWNDARATTMPERERLKIANGEHAGYTTHADCFMTAQTVMGVEDTALGGKTTTSPIVDKEGGRGSLAPHPLGESAGPGSAISTNSPTRSLQAFLDFAIPKFYAELQKEPQTQLAKDYLKESTRTSTAGYMFAYRQLASVPKYAPLLEMFSRKFKVNEYVSPEVGEGLAVINDPIVRNKRQTEIMEGQKPAEEELWNYHFAGVVMKDGDEYVTLENYSVGDDKVDNQKWLFQLYGTGKQSFHGEMKGKKGVEGGAPLSLGFTKS